MLPVLVPLLQRSAKQRGLFQQAGEFSVPVFELSKSKLSSSWVFMHPHKKCGLGFGTRPGISAASDPIGPRLCRILDMNFREILKSPSSETSVNKGKKKKGRGP